MSEITINDVYKTLKNYPEYFVGESSWVYGHIIVKFGYKGSNDNPMVILNEGDYSEVVSTSKADLIRIQELSKKSLESATTFSKETLEMFGVYK